MIAQNESIIAACKQQGFTCIAIALAVMSSSASAETQSAPSSAAGTMQCEALVSADFTGIADAPTKITEARFSNATEAVPGHCQANGYVAPNVGFSLRLPAVWNGKFLQVGCGGYCGEMVSSAPACEDSLRKGYACLVSDTGHRAGPFEALWAYQNLQAKVDYAFRATHVAALAGKAIVGRYYASGLKKSYFMGCSNGGRQALQEAQRFPWDFDGIIAGAPAINVAATMTALAWGIRVTHDSAGRALLGIDEVKLLNSAALAKCDLDDGVKDGIIGDPLHCAFDPAELACKRGQALGCLTSKQIEAAGKVYGGPTTASGMKLAPGPVPGTEYSKSGGWTVAYTGANGQPSFFEPLVTDGFRYLMFSPEPGRGWRLSDFDFERDYQRLGVMQSLLDSSNPDLRSFKAAGGKLIVYHGMNDIAVLPQSSVDYYETVQRTLGGARSTADFFRLFMLPGVQHCWGGNGADAVDLLSYLEAWVERGQAPDWILTGHLKDEPAGYPYPYRSLPADSAQLKFTRPVYPYPARAKYNGTGDPNDAANFGRVEPIPH